MRRQDPFSNTNFTPSGLQRGKSLQVGSVGKRPLHNSPFYLHHRHGFIFEYQMAGTDLPHFPVGGYFKTDTVPGELFPVGGQGVDWLIGLILVD
jgi:hypothetical protein